MKKLSILVCSLLVLSCNAPEKNIKGQWQIADVITPDTADSANFTLVAMIALQVIPASIDITEDHIFFKDKTGATVDSTKYILSGDDQVQIINGKDTSSGSWKMNKNDLELSFGKVSFKLTAKK